MASELLWVSGVEQLYITTAEAKGNGGQLPAPLQAAVNRTALRRSLADHGLLEYSSYRG